MNRKSKLIIISAFVAAVILAFLIFSQTTLGKRIDLPGWVANAIRELLSSGQLHACDYKDGTIILVKPRKTGVGEGALEAGDIVAFKDGGEQCGKFGDGDGFLGEGERTTLLPLYYAGKLTEEQKQALLEPEYEMTNDKAQMSNQAQNPNDKNGNLDLSHLDLNGNLDFDIRNSERSQQQMAKRRAYGVDYTLVLSDREILKARQFQKLDRIPEIEFSAIIKKQNPNEVGLRGFLKSDFEAQNQKTVISDGLLADSNRVGQSSIGSKFSIANRNNLSRGFVDKPVGGFAPPESSLPMLIPNSITGYPPDYQNSADKSNFNEVGLQEQGPSFKNPQGRSLGNSVVRLSRHLALYETIRNRVFNSFKIVARAVLPSAFADSVPEVVKIVDPGQGTGYHYQYLNTWEDAMDDNLVLGTLNGNVPYISVAKCRATGGVADQTAVTISGWTTDSTHYIKIWTDPSESYRHSGKWDTGYQLIPSSTTNGITNYEENVRVDGLAIGGTNWNYSAGLAAFRNYASGLNDVRISNNLFFNINNVGASQEGDGYNSNTAATGEVRIWNNIIYSNGLYGYYGICPGYSANGKKYYIYNNTIVDMYYGILSASTPSLTLADVKNNIVQGGNTNYWSNNWGTASNNLSEDATSPNTEFRNKVVTFADEANDDFHLVYSDTGAKDYGTNLSNDANLAFSDDIEGQVRSGSWDIGADESVATTIYRSVGPGSTTALASSTGATLTISGSTATFSSGMPNNMGVGDVIIYNATGTTAKNSLAFVHGRNSATNYTVKDVGGHIASSTSASTNWQVFRAYTSLSEAEAGTENSGLPDNLQYFESWADGKNLASSTEQWNIAAYADAVDLYHTAIDDWTTTADNYLRIYTPYLATEVGISQRHNGKWDDSKFRLDFSAGGGINFAVGTIANMRIEGLQIDQPQTWNSALQFYSSTGVTDYRVSENIIRGVYSVVDHGGISISDAGPAGSKIYIWNNIIYDFEGHGAFDFDSGYAINFNDNDFTAYIYNNTFYGNDIGFLAFDGAKVLKNNLAYNNAYKNYYDYYSGGYGAGTTNNLSGPTQTDAPGTNPKNGVTVQFVDAANKDFHLRAGDSAARGYGANLSDDANLPFSNDIDNENRSETGPWDIGADEVARTTQLNTPLVGRGPTSGLVGYWSFDGQNMGTTSARDLTTNNNTGWLINGPKKVPGISGQALAFDGQNDWVNLGTSQILQPSNLTASAWIKRTADWNDEQFSVVWAKSVWASPGWSFNMDGVNNWALELNVDYGNSYYISGEPNLIFPLNQWTHVAITFDSSTDEGKIYVNGISQSYSTYFTPDSITGTSDIKRIGTDNSGVFAPVIIDEVRIYNRALSASEVQELYRLGSARAKANSPITDFMKDSSLVGSWTFNGQDMGTTSARDTSGNNNTGWLINGPKKVPGISGQALKFDGVDDYVRVNAPAIPTTGSFSLWWKPNEALGTADHPLFTTRTSSPTTKIFDIYPYIDNKIYAGWYNNANDDRVLWTMSGIAQGTWYHIALTWTNSGNTTLYIDGVNKGSTSALDATWDTTGVANYFGANVLDINARARAEIDEVRIYNRVLGAEEVMQLYNAGSRKIKPTQ